MIWGDWRRGPEGNGQKHGAWVRRPLTAELRSLNFIPKATGNQCNIFFFVEEKPLEELSFQKLKRESIRGEENGSRENVARVVVGEDQ